MARAPLRPLPRLDLPRLFQMRQAVIQNLLYQRAVERLPEKLEQRPESVRVGLPRIVVKRQAKLGMRVLVLAVKPVRALQHLPHVVLVLGRPPARGQHRVKIAGIEHELRAREEPAHEIQLDMQERPVAQLQRLAHVPANLLEATDPRVGAGPQEGAGKQRRQLAAIGLGVDRLDPEPWLARIGLLAARPGRLGRPRHRDRGPGPREMHQGIVVLAPDQVAGQAIEQVLQHRRPRPAIGDDKDVGTRTVLHGVALAEPHRPAQTKEKAPQGGLFQIFRDRSP